MVPAPDSTLVRRPGPSPEGPQSNRAITAAAGRSHGRIRQVETAAGQRSGLRAAGAFRSSSRSMMKGYRWPENCRAVAPRLPSVHMREIARA